MLLNVTHWAFKFVAQKESPNLPCTLPHFLPGVLRTAVPDMDRESRDEYLVVLQAKDMGGHLGGLSGTTTVTIKLTDVNDNPPHFRRSKCRYRRIASASATFNPGSCKNVCVRAQIGMIKRLVTAYATAI